VLLVHKVSGARQERTIRSVLPDGYTVIDDVSGIPYKATSETWDVTLLKKGDPNARPHENGVSFKEFAEREAAALFNKRTFYHGTNAAVGGFSVEKAGGGIWFTNDRAEADTFREHHSLGKSSRIIEASLHPKNPFIHELTGQQFDFTKEMPRLIELAKQEGHDVNYIKNVRTVQPNQNWAVDHIYVLDDAAIEVTTPRNQERTNRARW
jgi:hypothetical protein